MPHAQPLRQAPPPARSPQDDTDAAVQATYLETLALIERLHRLLLDVIKDEFERLAVLDINAVQALLMFNIGANEVTAGELKTRGYYQGSNVSYNLKKLVEAGYMRHIRCAIDRRSVRVSLTEQGRAVADLVGALFARHSDTLSQRMGMDIASLGALNDQMRQMERFWVEQIRYIY
jgi:DNA-binding MarR family transcriptional regulator